MTDDRRVRKTKRALSTALAELLTTRPLKDITVQELADKADIHRATFYAHYHDVYELYSQLERDVLEEWKQMLHIGYPADYSWTYRSIMEYAEKNPELCRMLFSVNGDQAFQNDLYEVILDEYISTWKREDDLKVVTEEMLMLASYHIQGCIAIIERWVSGNFSYPRERVMALLMKIDTSLGSVEKFIR